MTRYCSAVAFFAMLAFACASKNNTDDGTSTTGGNSGFNATTGGSPATTNGGSTSITPDSGLSVLTQDQYDAINDAACVGWGSEGENSPALIDFVVDTSGSMDDVAPNTSDGRSKWAITSEALQNAVDSLPRQTVVGMLLWPNMQTVPNHNTDPIDTANCVNEPAMIPLAELGSVGSDQRLRLDNTLAATSPLGGTPMADAYNYALGYGMMAYAAIAPRYMVLITDGQPTIQLGCMGTGQEAYPVDFQPVLDSITGAFTTFGVKTFVIGSPGSEHQSSTGADGRASLSEAAKEGQTAPAGCSDNGPTYCHFDMSSAADFATGFADALKIITNQITSCDFYITNVPSGQIIDPAALNVIYKINGSSALGDMKLVAPSADDTCPQGNGWYLDPNDSTHVILCANTCDLIHQDAGAVLDFRGGCKALVHIG